MDEKDLKKIHQRFTEADSDKDGQLNRSELLNLLHSFGVKLGADQLTYIFLKADADGDGTISFEEFKNTCIGEQGKIQEPRSRRRSSSAVHVSKGAKRRRRSQSMPHSQLLRSRSLIPECEEVIFKDQNKKRPASVSGLPGTFSNYEVVKELKTPERNLKELIECCRYFWLSDENCDGRLSVSEFGKLTNVLDMKLNRPAMNRAFTIADTNKDGFISFKEFITTFLNKEDTRALSTKLIRDIFYKYDKNESGYLTKQKCFEALITLGNQSSMDRLEKMMTTMDLNNDGMISFDEFCSFLDFDDISTSTKRTEESDDVQTCI